MSDICLIYIMYFAFKLSLFSQTFFDSLAVFFIARFVEQSKHVALVCFHARLVEWVYFEKQSAYSASLLEEVYQLTDVVFVKFRNADMYVWHSSVDERQEPEESTPV